MLCCGRAIPEPEAASTLLSWILRQLRGGVPGHRSPELATAVAALSVSCPPRAQSAQCGSRASRDAWRGSCGWQIMVRNNDLRDEFRDAHGIEK